MKWFNKKVLISVVCSLLLLSSGIVYGEMSIPKQLTLTSLTICVSSEGAFRSIKELTGTCKPKDSEITLKGEKGEVGPSGAVGPQGPKGDTGATGTAGPQGPAGINGAVGPQGTQGLKGDTGAVGPQGLTGPFGPMGPSGAKGDTGAQGVAGLIGPQGIKGDTGAGISPEEIAALKTTNAQLQTTVAVLKAKVFPPATITPGDIFFPGAMKDIAQPITYTVKNELGEVVANTNVTVTVTGNAKIQGTVSDAFAGSFGATVTVITNASGVATAYFKPCAIPVPATGTMDVLTATAGTALTRTFYERLP